MNILTKLQLKHISCVAVVILTLVFMTAQNAFAQSIQVSAKLNPAQTVKGRPVVYTISVNSNGRMGNLEPQPPAITPAMGFQNFSFIGTQQQTSITNGVVSATLMYNYSFVPTQEGTFTIPPASVTNNGTIYKSAPVTLTVTAQQTAVQAPGSAPLPSELKDKVVNPIVPSSPELEKMLNGIIFILPTYDSLNICQGQQTTVAFHLLIDEQALQQLKINVGRLEVGPIKLPTFSQFVKEEVFGVPQQLSFEERTFGNRTYKVAPLYSVDLSPSKTGILNVEPFSVTFYISQRTQRINNDPFAMFDDLMGGRMANAIEVIAQSPELKFNVAPLPSDNKPGDFSGGVGKYSLSATVDKTTARANDDLINLQVKIEGEGDASVISAPAFQDTDSLHLLEPPKSNTAKRTEGTKRLSSKTFDYLLRPIKQGKAEIPSIGISTYNPQTKSYESLKTSPLTVNITTGTLTPPLTIATQQPVADKNLSGTAAKSKEGTGPDIAYIHEAWELTKSCDLSKSSVIGFFLALIGAVLLPLAGAMIKRYWDNAKPTASSISRKALANARKSLKVAQKRISEHKEQDFAKEMSTTIRRYYAAKFQVDSQSLTGEHIEEMLLRLNGCSYEFAADVRQTLDMFDSAQYTLSDSDETVLRKRLEKASSLIEDSERFFS